MTRVAALLIATAVFGSAGTAAAGPCEQLAGARWLHYIEGGRPTARAGVSVWDFRTGVVGATVFAAAGPAPFPPTNPSAPYGGSELQQVMSCRATGNVATIAVNAGASVLVTVSADGKSATTAGGQNLAGMVGWAVRQPN